MTGPKEIDQLGASAGPPDLICPFMSGQAIPAATTGKVAVPGHIGVITMLVPCSLEKCGCFNTDSRTCSFNYIPKAAAAIECLDETLEGIDSNLTELNSIVEKSKTLLFNFLQAFVKFSRSFIPPLNGQTSLGQIADTLKDLVGLRKDKGK